MYSSKFHYSRFINYFFTLHAVDGWKVATCLVVCLYQQYYHLHFFVYSFAVVGLLILSPVNTCLPYQRCTDFPVHPKLYLCVKDQYSRLCKLLDCSPLADSPISWLFSNFQFIRENNRMYDSVRSSLDMWALPSWRRHVKFICRPCSIAETSYQIFLPQVWWYHQRILVHKLPSGWNESAGSPQQRSIEWIPGILISNDHPLNPLLNPLLILSR